MTITWTRSTKVGQSSLLGYTVEMYGRNDTDGWVPVASRLLDTTYTHEGLTAGISYYFVVRAENTHGMSSPSAISEPVIVGIVSRFYLLKRKKFRRLKLCTFYLVHLKFASVSFCHLCLKCNSKNK